MEMYMITQDLCPSSTCSPDYLRFCQKFKNWAPNQQLVGSKDEQSVVIITRLRRHRKTHRPYYVMETIHVSSGVSRMEHFTSAKELKRETRLAFSDLPAGTTAGCVGAVDQYGGEPCFLFPRARLHK